MRALLIAAALLAALPAHAKTWSDEGCSFAVQSAGDGFRVFSDGNADYFCKVEDWPISSPIAVLSCDNGSKPEMQLADNGNVMVFEDRTLYVPTDENGICD